jgi:hypothetical protein
VTRLRQAADIGNIISFFLVVNPAYGFLDLTPCPGSIGISRRKKGEGQKKTGPLIVVSGPERGERLIVGAVCK